MSQGRLSRKERERLAHREAILKAALDLFSEHGLHGVSMHQIAERAEFATGTLYNFFENKEALFQAILVRCAERIESAVMPIVTGPGSPEIRLRTLVRAHDAIIRENLKEIRLFYKVFQAEARHTVEPDLLTAEVREVFDRLNGACAGVFEEGISTGVFVEIDPETAAIALDAMLEAVSFRAAATGGLDRVAAWLGDIERLFFEGICVRGGDHAAG